MLFKSHSLNIKFNCSVDSNWIVFPQVIVTAKFWFVSDLTGGQANAEAQAAKYHHCHHHYYNHCYHHYYHHCCNIHHYNQIIALSVKITFRYVVEMNGALGRSEIAIEYRQWGSVQMLEQTNAEMISCIHYCIKIGYA